MSIDVTTLAVSKNYTDKQIEKASIKGIDLSGYVQSVNGVKPDKNGNVEVSGGNVDLAITGATVGQTVKISAVDENGVPTAWMPTDFPSGGSGGEEWRLINTFTIETEDLAKVYFNTDLDGNPFELKELWVQGDGTNASTHSGSTSLGVFIRFGDGTTGDKNQYDYPVACNSGTMNYQRGFDVWYDHISKKQGRYIAAALGNQKVTQMNATAMFGASNNKWEVDKIREIAIFPGTGSVLYGVGTVISIYGR